MLNIISTVVENLMLKPSFYISSDTIIVGECKGVHTFPKCISPKVYIIEWLELELAYNNVADQHVSNYVKEIYNW